MGALHKSDDDDVEDRDGTEKHTNSPFFMNLVLDASSE